jgi:TonB family protein
MKKKFPILIMYLGCSLGVAANEPEADAQPVTPVSIATKVEFIGTEPPVYPRRALKEGIEGWVVLKMVVLPDGTTDQIEVVSSSIDGEFDRAAIESAKTRVYKPATSNGEPVMQANHQARYVFMIAGREGGVTKKFKHAYGKVQEAINANDLEKAQKLIDKMDGAKQRVMAEVCYLDMLKAAYYAKSGDDKAKLRHVERALVIADEVAIKSIYFQLLRQAITDNAMASNFYRSIEHYEKLVEEDDSLAADDPVHEFIGKVKAVMDGDKNIPRTGKISRECYLCDEGQGFTDLTLNRNQFTIDQVEGNVEKLDILCEASVVSVKYEPEMLWGVNRKGGACSVKVIGKVGTGFRLIEMPNK